MAELGETNDPVELVPGNHSAIAENAVAIGGRGQTLLQVGASLRTIDTGDAWRGSAADRFRDVFHTQPPKWNTAGDSFASAAAALSRYAETLAWAQSRAAEAIAVWNESEASTAAARAAYNRESGPFVDPGEAGREHARYLLANAREQLAGAGSEAAASIRAATEAAGKPGLVANLLDWRSELAAGAMDSIESYIDLVERFNTLRLVSDPTGLLDDAADIGRGLAVAATNPAGFVEQMVDLETWKESPARALGQLLPDAAAGALTGGGGFLGRHAATEALEAADDVAENAAEAAGRQLDVPLGMPLNEADRAALIDYTGPGFRDINPALRSGIVDDAMQVRVDAITSALDKLPPYQGVVYRGVDLPPQVLADYQPGQVVSDSAFTSTSATQSQGFKGPVELEIFSYTGRDIRMYADPKYAHQDEVLFPPGTELRVESRFYDEATGRVHISMREVVQ